MNHNDAVDLLGHCECACHGGEPGPCWCRNVRLADPYEISHNDRVAYLGACQCRHAPCRWDHTAPELSRALRDREDRQRDERLRAGRPRSGDLSYLARNPARYPQYFGLLRP